MYDKYDVSMSFEEINRLLELSLFVFNYQRFRHTSGTTMGKNMYPVLPLYSWLIWRMKSYVKLSVNHW